MAMLRKKQGYTLPLVILIITILVLLGAALLGGTFQTFRMSKSQTTINYASHAGDSAIERWLSLIDDKIKSVDYSQKFAHISDYQDFADAVVADILTDLRSGGYDTEYIDVIDDKANNNKTYKSVSDPDTGAYAIVHMNDLRNRTTNYTVNGGQMDVVIGIQAQASYTKNGSLYKAGNKEIYGEHSFTLRVPVDGFKLYGPVYSVNDFHVSGGTTNIKGDTYVFGSYPKKVLELEQWFYGGIYARNNALLNLNGNVYSRGQIRTGKYMDRAGASIENTPDNSTIHISKDAVAQGIQLYGDGSNVVVWRHAYTFDDLEVVGANAVLAVNGSYFGLEEGARDNHDESSAVVVSAPIHNRPISTNAYLNSLKSRIVVNGDVVIRGSTFKIDNTNITAQAIENASLGWDIDNDNAFYKTYSDQWIDYHERIRSLHDDNVGKFGGFFNLFQVWRQKSPNYTTMNSWLQLIRNEVVQTRANDVTKFELNPSSISGLFNNELAANERLYRFPQAYDNDPAEFYEIERIKNINSGSVQPNTIGKYLIDNIYDQNDKRNLVFGNDYWDGAYNAPTIAGTNDALHADYYLFEVPNRCKHLSYELMQLTHFFAAREYPNDPAVSPAWEYTNNLPLSVNRSYTDPITNANVVGTIEPRAVFSELLDKLENLYNAGNTNNPNYVYVPINHYPDGTVIDVDDVYKDFRSVNPANPQSAYNWRNADLSLDNEYLLIVCEDSEVTLKVSGEYNGIIFTSGKVLLTYDPVANTSANIRGAIVSAGYTDMLNNPVAQQIDSANAGSMDNGDLAGIVVRPNATQPIEVDFYLGHQPKDRFIGDLNNGTFGGGDDVDSVTASIGDSTDFINRAARERILQKFRLKGIELKNIF